jgi:hypothetical protein
MGKACTCVVGTAEVSVWWDEKQIGHHQVVGVSGVLQIAAHSW